MISISESNSDGKLSLPRKWPQTGLGYANITTDLSFSRRVLYDMAIKWSEGRKLFGQVSTNAYDVLFLNLSGHRYPEHERIQLLDYQQQLDFQKMDLAQRMRFIDRFQCRRVIIDDAWEMVFGKTESAHPLAVSYGQTAVFKTLRQWGWENDASVLIRTIPPDSKTDKGSKQRISNESRGNSRLGEICSWGMTFGPAKVDYVLRLIVPSGRREYVYQAKWDYDSDESFITGHFTGRPPRNAEAAKAILILSKSMSRKEIAEAMGVSLRTVSYYLSDARKEGELNHMFHY